MPVDGSAGRDIDRDGARDVVVQADDHRMTAHRTNGAVDDDVAFVDFDAGLGGDGLGDLGRGDRTEQTTLVAGLGRDRDAPKAE